MSFAQNERRAAQAVAKVDEVAAGQRPERFSSAAGIYWKERNFMTQSDATRPSLLVRIKDHRDRQAWGQFVEIYAPLVYDMARRRLQDSDAADLTQDVLRSVAAAMDRLDYDPGKGSFRSWLFTVTRNALNTFFEAQRRVPRGSGDSAVQAWLDKQPDQDDESAVWDREYERRLLDLAAEQVRPPSKTRPGRRSGGRPWKVSPAKRWRQPGDDRGRGVHRQEPGAQPDQGTCPPITGRMTRGRDLMCRKHLVPEPS